MSDAQPASADYYREKAEEIRHFARRCRFSEIGEELFELAERFDRMAAAVEKRRRINHEPHVLVSEILRALLRKRLP